MKDTGPRMRGSYLQGNVASLSLLGPEAEAQIRAALPAGLLDDIAAASRVDWLPALWDVELTAAVHRVAGDAGLRAWGKKALLTSVEGPLLRPILQTTLAVFGVSPGVIFRYAKNAWTSIYRDAGELRVEDAGPRSVNLFLENVPEEVCSRVYLEGTAGAFEAVLEIARCDGTVALEVTAPNTARYSIAWT